MNKKIYQGVKCYPLKGKLHHNKPRYSRFLLTGQANFTEKIYVLYFPAPSTKNERKISLGSSLEFWILTFFYFH